MKPVGRPPFEITEAVCKQAESLAAQGLTQIQIAAVLGMGQSTLYEKLIQYPEFMEAITVGKAKGITQVTNALFKKAVDGDVPAQKYYLNNRDNANWKDRVDSTISGPDGGPVQIQEVKRVIVDTNHSDS